LGIYDDAIELRERRMVDIPPRPSDYRTRFERDYDRVIQAPSFRRLQGKSQLFGAGFGDYYRTRLTHSLEVAQIARDVTRFLIETDRERLRSEERPGLMLHPIVVESGALLHDIGHPPFGHFGEEILNIWLSNSKLKDDNKGPGSFEGNAQNFRWIMFLENSIALAKDGKRFDILDGLNLTHAVLLAVNKYPTCIADGVKKGVYRREWADIGRIREQWGIPEGQPTLEAQVMDYSDDIAYSTHDIEDGVKAGLVDIRVLTGQDDATISYIQNGIIAAMKKHRKDRPHWQRLINESLTEGEIQDINNAADAIIRGEVVRVLEQYLEQWKTAIEKCNSDIAMASREMKGHRVHEYITSLKIVDEHGWRRLRFARNTGSSGSTISFDLERQLDILKYFAYVAIVEAPDVQRAQYKSKSILDGLIVALGDETTGRRLLPVKWVQRQQRIQGEGGLWDWVTLATDYIAGMTDGFATKFFTDLYR